MGDELHISSLVVQARPSMLRPVRAAITRVPGAEIEAVGSGGQVVVTLETCDEAEFLRRFSEIDRLPGVLSTMLVFHQVDIASEWGEV